MKKLVLFITLIFSISTINAEVINKKCVSQKTGKSTYNINLDTISL